MPAGGAEMFVRRLTMPGGRTGSRRPTGSPGRARPGPGSRCCGRGPARPTPARAAGSGAPVTPGRPALLSLGGRSYRDSGEDFCKRGPQLAGSIDRLQADRAHSDISPMPAPAAAYDFAVVSCQSPARTLAPAYRDSGEAIPGFRGGSYRDSGEAIPGFRGGSYRDSGEAIPGFRGGSYRDSGEAIPGFRGGSYRDSGEAIPGFRGGSYRDSGEAIPGFRGGKSP